MKRNLDELLVRESLASGEYKRCYRCFRPKPSCFCHAIPSVENQTDVLILQHPRERFHPFNTARIVRMALENSSLVFGDLNDLKTSDFNFHKNARLLYPSSDAPIIDELDERDYPQQLVIVDGTWHHAKTLVRDIPTLRALPRCRLSPQDPGRYRIRREPNETALSTLEATVAALQCLEPDTQGFEQLVRAFDTMVEQQLQHASASPRWRQRDNSIGVSINIPRTIVHDLDSVVVAYGESEPGGKGDSKKDRLPVYWVADRIATGELFQCTIQSRRPFDEAFLRHLEVDASHFDDAVTVREFRDRWRKFLNPHETVAVYGGSTARLLKTAQAEFCPNLALKSVEFNKARHYQSLSELIAAEKICVESPKLPGRAGKRLSNALAFVRHLHALV